MDEHNKKFIVFIVPNKRYCIFLSACVTHQPFSKDLLIFQDLIQNKIVLTYMDNLIIPSINYEAGIENLRVVLKVASETGLAINWLKCQFLQQRVEFLGHVIHNDRVSPSERKTEAVRKFSESKSIKQVQSFLELSRYFRKFIPQYSIIARPLINLLRER
jgi:hypothetical protein